MCLWTAVFVERLRAGSDADGLPSPLDFRNLAAFDAGPPALWRFIASAGDRRRSKSNCARKWSKGKTRPFFI